MSGLRIEGARICGDELILRLRDPGEAARAVYRFKPGLYELQPVRKQRSRDANAYCWVLIDKLARKLHEEPVELYRRYVRDLGCRTSVCCVKAEDVELESKTFLAGHLGRMVQVGESKLPGCVTLRKLYGSSSYDSAQMAAFIDALIQDCRALDIETRPQEEIDSLLAQWGGGA